VEAIQARLKKGPQPRPYFCGDRIFATPDSLLERLEFSTYIG